MGHFSGSLYGGKVPGGLSLGFSLYNGRIARHCSRKLFDRKNIAGSVSITGTLATSGINPLSWVSQSDATLTVAARGA